MKTLISILIVTILISCANADSKSKTIGTLSSSPSPFAINGTKIAHITGNTELVGNFKILEELGAKWDRSDLWWHKIETVRGKFDYTFSDKIVSNFLCRNLCLLPILDYGANWSKEAAAPITEKERKEFANYVYKVVKRYPQITYWEVWNEPNLKMFWKHPPNAKLYTKLLKSAAIAARKANPNVKIVGGVLAGAQWDYIEDMYLAGAKKYCDVFSYHYYRQNMPDEEVENEILKLKALMSRFGDGEKPVWITEMGVTTHPKTGVDYETQAAYLVRNYVVALSFPWVERIFQFDMVNWYDDPNGPWDAHLGLVEASRKRKPSFYAYSNMVVRLTQKNGSPCKLKKIKWSNKKIRAYYYEKNGKSCLVAWSDKSKKIKILPGKAGMKIYDNSGKMIPTPKPEINNKISVKLSKTPIYIIGISPSYKQKTSLSFLKNAVPCSPGEKTELKLSLRNYSESNITANLSWLIKTATPGTKLKLSLAGPEKITVPPKKKIITNAVLSVMADMLADQSVKCFCIADIDGLKAEAVCFTPITPPLKLSTHLLAKNGKLFLKTEACQIGKSAQGGTIKVVSNHQNMSTVLTENIDFSSGRVVSWETPIEKERIEKIKTPLDFIAKWQNNNKQSVSKPMRVAIHSFDNSVPEINGKLYDVKYYSPMFLNSANQAADSGNFFSDNDGVGEISCQWSTNGLFFTLKVRDKNWPVNNFPPVELWKGDAIEFYIGMTPPDGRVRYNESDAQIGIGFTKNPNKPITWNWKSQTNLFGVKLAYGKSKSGENIVEGFIPEKNFPAPMPKKGDLISFDVSLKDYDSDEKYSAMIWHGDGRNWLNPINWGTALVK